MFNLLPHVLPKISKKIPVLEVTQARVGTGCMTRRHRLRTIPGVSLTLRKQRVGSRLNPSVGFIEVAWIEFRVGLLDAAHALCAVWATSAASLLVQQRSQIARTMQDTLDAYTLIIGRKEDDVGTVSAGPNPLLQLWPLNVAKWCLGNLACVFKQFVFKLAGAFGIVESDEVRYLDEIRFRPTRQLDAYYLSGAARTRRRARFLAMTSSIVPTSSLSIPSWIAALSSA